jgi:hypothetical protein
MLATQLVWRIEKFKPNRERFSAATRQAPTWSWLGLNAQIRAHYKPYCRSYLTKGPPIVKILHAEASLQQPRSEVDQMRWQGHILIEAFLSRVQKRKSRGRNPIREVDDCNHCGLRFWRDTPRLVEQELFFLSLLRKTNEQP